MRVAVVEPLRRSVAGRRDGDGGWTVAGGRPSAVLGRPLATEALASGSCPLSQAALPAQGPVWTTNAKRRGSREEGLHQRAVAAGERVSRERRQRGAAAAGSGGSDEIRPRGAMAARRGGSGSDGGGERRQPGAVAAGSGSSRERPNTGAAAAESGGSGERRPRGAAAARSCSSREQQQEEAEEVERGSGKER